MKIKLSNSQPVPLMTSVSQSEMNIQISRSNAQHLNEILKISLEIFLKDTLTE